MKYVQKRYSNQDQMLILLDIDPRIETREQIPPRKMIIVDCLKNINFILTIGERDPESSLPCGQQYKRCINMQYPI